MQCYNTQILHFQKPPECPKVWLLNFTLSLLLYSVLQIVCWSGAACPTYNDPITQFLAAQFDAVGQKYICFSRRICHRRKIVFVQKARSLFVLDSFTHHITCGLVPRGSILPFMDGKISNSFPTSFYCLAFYNGNYGCLSHSQD